MLCAHTFCVHCKSLSTRDVHTYKYAHNLLRPTECNLGYQQMDLSISTPMEITVQTHLYAWYRSKTTLVYLTPDGDTSWPLFRSSVSCSVRWPLVHPRCDKTGPRKSEMIGSQHYSQLQSIFISLSLSQLIW